MSDKAVFNCTNHYCSIINRVNLLMWSIVRCIESIVFITAGKETIMLHIEGKKCSLVFLSSRWENFNVSRVRFDVQIWSLLSWHGGVLEFKDRSILSYAIVPWVRIHISVSVLIASECSVSSVNNSNTQRRQLSRAHVRSWKFNVKHSGITWAFCNLPCKMYASKSDCQYSKRHPLFWRQKNPIHFLTRRI